MQQDQINADAARDVDAPPGTPRRRRLGEVLIDRNAVAPCAVEEALTLQERRPERIGQLLRSLGHIDDQALIEALVAQGRVPVASLAERDIPAEVLSLVPPEVSMRHKAVPFAAEDGTLSVALADPFDRSVLEMLRLMTGRRIERHYCPPSELTDAARRLYGSSVQRMIADLDAPGDVESAGEEQLTHHLAEMASEPSIVNLVNLVILEAIGARASDIHVEPFETDLRVKIRVDGLLHDLSPPPKRLHAAIVSRIKIMAGMNIAERFVPQDGHISFAAPSGTIDLRVATVPTVFGECVVMRILDRATMLIGLEQLGLSERTQPRFTELLERPHGMLLVTGPTGSGKTTTLYAALNRIYTPTRKIITIEDPVEYRLDGINQIPVNPKRGLDFANGLRAIVRQDPDIIMVGEIRDRETAEIAIRSALTGHLVFSTLHTNDAAGAVSRLLDMGVEPFLLASSLIGVLAQRLVRTICPHCRRPHRPEPHLLERVGHQPTDAAEGDFFAGQGCAQCRQTGYQGRRGIFELLRVTPAVRGAIGARATTDEIVRLAPPDHEPMREDGYRKAVAGLTTLEEVLRVTQDTRAEMD